ncbi:MAG: phenylalanine--tRNA ligase subunit beta [Candidatus Desulforudis sp.]|nr:phenylalanine--tRNA ligase subunit beta [Desulforudis sp.]
MRVSLGWLREFVEIPVPAAELAERLTFAGVAVDRVDEPGKDVSGVVTGEILEVQPHPNADRLVIARVGIGEGELQIVTGAMNFKTGDVVPVAPVGATLAGGLSIRRAKFRGVESWGMLCAADELGVGEDHEGILILPPGTPVGVEAGPLLGLDDQILELDLTPNRGDCLSVRGVAREVATILNLPLRTPEPVLVELQALATDRAVRVDIEDPGLCGRYVARMIVDVIVKPSPLWLQRRLFAAGMRPINNIVDVTNYVMLEWGQPQHAFDFDTVTGGHVIVRNARPGEVLITLDGQERRLAPEMLLIADPGRAIGIAGVMGGLDSEVTAGTSRILLESAYFNPVSIRRTAKALGLRSEASNRFEKGVDPDGCLRAADRAVELIHRIGAGRIAAGAVDAYPAPYVPKTIILRPERVEHILGVSVPPEEIKGVLERLEFSVREAEGRFLAGIPSHRTDVAREIDLIEEVARIYGYDRVPPTLPFGTTTAGVRTAAQAFEVNLKGWLTACGLTEVITYTFTNRKVFDRLRFPEDDGRRRTVRLRNPLNEEQAVMRTLLYPSLLDVLARNYQRRVTNAALFEIGRVYLPREDALLPEERLTLVIALLGRTPADWRRKDEPMDFFHLKGILEAVIPRAGIGPLDFVPESGEPTFHPGRTARLLVGETSLGIVGEIHPEVLDEYDLPHGVVAAEVDLETMVALEKQSPMFTPLPRFPSVDRDLAVVIRKDFPVAEVTAVIRQAGGEFLREVRLFDVYEGRQIRKGCRSLGFALNFRAEDRTLTDEEIGQYLGKVVGALENAFQAELRAQA